MAMKEFPIPVVALGPGSQVEDEELQYAPMPETMQTYHAPNVPDELPADSGVRAALQRVLAALDAWTPGASLSVPLDALAPSDLAQLHQILGDGEVSARVDRADGPVLVQESVFAGVWRVAGDGVERIEVAAMPAVVRCHAGGVPADDAPPLPGPGISSAPALVAEIAHHLREGGDHVINLSLMPYTPEDGVAIDQHLGRGAASILSRGYGNCRVSATGRERVWWVQYFNSQDALILNTLEITTLPEVALAAAEDIADSRGRLAEVLDWLG